MEQIFLKPGDIFCSDRPAVVRTVLGSCISVCIFDQRLSVGGINHFLLPSGSRQDELSNPNKYGSKAIPNLLRAMKGLGSKKNDIVIKLIGGSSLISSDDSGVVDVGTKNIEMARDVLKSFGFEVYAEVVGGFLGRELLFNTSTGDVRFKCIERLNRSRKEMLIKVLVVDDSKTIRKYLRNIIEQDSAMTVIGEASHPFEAMEIRKKQPVDVMTLDLNMPYMDGVSYLKKFMIEDPIPAIIITDYSINTSNAVLEALESGAFDYIHKPSFHNDRQVENGIREKIATAFQTKPLTTLNNAKKKILHKDLYVNSAAIKNSILAVGASTGGTEAIRNIFQRLPARIPPAVVVQHIPEAFSNAFARRLNQLCPFLVKEAEDGETLLEDHVYIAPGGRHMKVINDRNSLKIQITKDEPINGFRPSVDYLFESLASIKVKKIVPVLLTGMGSDGAAGLLKLKNGGCETIAQDEATCVVFGMPKAAINLNAVDHIVPLHEIATKIVDSLNMNKKANFKPRNYKIKTAS